MRSFDEFGFEKKSNTVENNGTPATEDFITRRKETKKQDTPVAESKALDTLKTETAISAESARPVMTVMSVKGNENREITRPSGRIKNPLAEENVLEKRKKKLPVRTVAIIACVFALAFLMINQFVLVNEYSKGISSLEKSIESIEADIKQCETELVIKNKDVEKTAKENGMISDKDGQGEYIQIPVSDTIELYAPEEESQQSLASIVMSALGENILRAWNTLTGAE